MRFGRILRSGLRKDPEIILISKIRDQESAATAVGAATSGHVVLSSLHTHAALETLTGLRNLNVPSHVLGDALQGVISQKLVPPIRPVFAKPVHHDNEILI